MIRLSNNILEVIDAGIDEDTLMVSSPAITAIEERPGLRRERTERNRNILDLVFYAIERTTQWGEAPFSSWVLARLWYLTEGSIAAGLRLDEEGKGFQDGGWYTCNFKVVDAKHEVLAYLFLEGCDFYQQLYITSYQDYFNPEDIEQQLAEILVKAPHELSPCDITVLDPETGKKHNYGWNGRKFLGSGR